MDNEKTERARISKTRAQKIVEFEAKLAILREKDRALENGQKIILGGMLLSSARSNPTTAKWVIEEIDKNVKRQIDLDRLRPLIDELKKIGTKKPDGPLEEVEGSKKALPSSKSKGF